MRNNILKLFTMVLLLASGYAQAISLGKMTTYSALNQPFEAEIPLLSVAKGELDGIKVSIASEEAFKRANLDRPFILSSLNFEKLLKDNGQTVIRITSRKSIPEPYLNFLLEVSSPRERVLKEYAVLLDVPR